MRLRKQGSFAFCKAACGDSQASICEAESAQHRTLDVLSRERILPVRIFNFNSQATRAASGTRFHADTVEIAWALSFFLASSLAGISQIVEAQFAVKRR